MAPYCSKASKRGLALFHQPEPSILVAGCLREGCCVGDRPAWHVMDTKMVCSCSCSCSRHAGSITAQEWPFGSIGRPMRMFVSGMLLLEARASADELLPNGQQKNAVNKSRSIGGPNAGSVSLGRDPFASIATTQAFIRCDTGLRPIIPYMLRSRVYVLRCQSLVGFLPRRQPPSVLASRTSSCPRWAVIS